MIHTRNSKRPVIQSSFDDAVRVNMMHILLSKQTVFSVFSRKQTGSMPVGRGLHELRVFMYAIARCGRRVQRKVPFSSCAACVITIGLQYRPRVSIDRCRLSLIAARMFACPYSYSEQWLPRLRPPAKHEPRSVRRPSSNKYFNVR